ncbi:MAG: DHHA1 domain-containing protein, partial [Caldimicrobium sp.]
EIWEKIEASLAEKEDDPILIGVFENIPKALLGLLANRAKNRYGKPVLLLSEEDNLYYGSGRSLEDFDLLKILLPKRELFLELGGHQKAFGFKLYKENLKHLKDYLFSQGEIINFGGSARFGYVDAEATLSEIFLEENLSAFQTLPPYGIAHEPPLLLFKNFEIKEISYPKERHTKLLLKEGAKEIYALCFNKIISEKIKFLIGTPFINNFSQQLEIKIEDVKEQIY